MLAAISFIVIILFSLIVIKVGAVALEATGLSTDIAKFQSQSAFSGVGFTTEESEMLMRNAVRRQILRLLMLMGSAGLTSGLATLVLTFVSSTGTVTFFGYTTTTLVFNVVSIIVVLSILLLVSETKIFDKLIKLILKGPLKKIKQKVNLYDYETVLGLSKGYGIVTFRVGTKHWMAHKRVKTLDLDREGIVIMGVEREIHNQNEYFGAPSENFAIHPGDKVIVYSLEDSAAKLSTRERGAKGTKEHYDSIEIHKSYKQILKIDEEKARAVIASKKGETKPSIFSKKKK